MPSPMTAVGTSPGAAEGAPMLPLVPFTRASSRYEEPFLDESNTLVAGSVQVGLFDVPAYGYLRGIWLRCRATGGDAGLAIVAGAADAPWSVVSQIALQDVNGNNLVGPFTGYDLYLINKWGAFNNPFDPVDSPAYSAIDSDGNFTWTLFVPVEFVARNALGSLPNMNASATYKLRIEQAGAATVYGTEPDTLPAVRFDATVLCWAPPAAADAAGQPQAVEPPAVDTTAYWSKQTIGGITNGENNPRLQRVGNLIRSMIFVTRDGGVRDETGLPTSWRLEFDGSTLWNRTDALWEEHMRKAYGYAPDTAVRALVLTDDFDGTAGSELRDYYLRTTQATRLELRFTTSAADIDQLDVITGDVAPRGNIFDLAI